MLVGSNRARRTATVCAGCVVAAAVGLAPAVLGPLRATAVHAAPVDCTPVGVEWIDNQLYYVEKCYGYNVYRPLE